MRFIKTNIVCKEEKEKIAIGAATASDVNLSISTAVITLLQYKNNAKVEYEKIDILTERLDRYLNKIEKEIIESAR